MRKLDLLIAEGDTARRQESAETLDGLLRLTAGERWTLLFRRDPRLGRLLLKDYQVFLQSLPINSELVLARDAVAGQPQPPEIDEPPASRPATVDGSSEPSELAALLRPRALAKPPVPAAEPPAARVPPPAADILSTLVILALIVLFAAAVAYALSTIRRDMSEAADKAGTLTTALTSLESRAAELAAAQARLERERFQGFAELLAAQSLEQAMLDGRPFTGALRTAQAYGPYPPALTAALDGLAPAAAAGLPTRAHLLTDLDAWLTAVSPRPVRFAPIWRAVDWVLGLWGFQVPAEPALVGRLAAARIALARDDPGPALALLAELPDPKAPDLQRLLTAAQTWRSVPDQLAAVRAHIVDKYGLSSP